MTVRRVFFTTNGTDGTDGAMQNEEFLSVKSPDSESGWFISFGCGWPGHFTAKLSWNAGFWMACPP
jgi:hypothetical protein